MKMRSEKIEFTNARGETLAARLDRAPGPARAFALFAHCFTCSKDFVAAARIAEALTEHGFAVLRFDFTGLGGSGGDFANTNFTSNVEDLLAAGAFLRENFEAPALLVGHSLGGGAVLAAASGIPEARAVATIAAPSDPAHVTGLFRQSMAEIDARGEAEVAIAGRPFRITRQFLEDVREQNLEHAITDLRKALLVLHAPRDEVVGIEHAGRIFAAAKHPKSFVSLDDADHLLTRREDAAYVADVLAVWASRFIGETEKNQAIAAEPGAVIVEEAGDGRYRQSVLVGGRHTLIADEPETVGGDDTGPTPHELLLAALGACTAMTLRMYAERKGLGLEHVAVTLRRDKVATGEGERERIERHIALSGDLPEAACQRMLEIAEKCPVHRTLTSNLRIDSRLI